MPVNPRAALPKSQQPLPPEPVPGDVVVELDAAGDVLPAPVPSAPSDPLPDALRKAPLASQDEQEALLARLPRLADLGALKAAQRRARAVAKAMGPRRLPGRPPSGHARTVRATVRFEPSDWQRLEHEAQRVRLDPAELIYRRAMLTLDFSSDETAFVVDVRFFSQENLQELRAFIQRANSANKK